MPLQRPDGRIRVARCQNDRCRRDGKPRPVEAGRVLCVVCVDRFAAAVVEVGNAWDALASALVGPKTGAAERVSGQPERPAPARAVVVELRGQIRHDVAWVAGLVADGRGIEPPATDDPGTLGPWVARHVEWLARLDDAGALLDVMTEHRRNARALLDLPAERSRFPVGPCPERDDDGQPCPGTVTAHIPRDEQKAALLKCRICEREWEPHAWRSIGRRILARSIRQPPR